MKIAGLILLCAGLGLLPAQGRAADRLLLLGGEVAEESYYSYAGLVLPLRELSSGRRLTQRYWLDRFGYRYTGTPGRIEADAWGAEAALGYVGGWTSGWMELSLGLRYTDTDLSPDDPGAKARGRQLGLKLQLQGERQLGEDWRIGAIAAYTSSQNAYWSRIRLLRRITATTAAGAELVAGGNEESDFQAAGLVLTLRPDGMRWNFGLRGGYRWGEDDDGGYAGLELGYGF